jgi:undecaprenyl-diphosphatase
VATQDHLSSGTEEAEKVSALAGIARLFRPAGPGDRGAARAVLLRRLALLAGPGLLLMLALMLTVDVAAIGIMPPRGAPQLWWVRVLTEFAKSAYVLWTLAGLWLASLLLAMALRGPAKVASAVWMARFALMFLCIGLPVLAGEVLKGVIGRGRPFVGGKADAFHFAPGSWTEAYASLPSGHATTAAALAVAIAVLWPRLRFAALGYYLVICITRVVLLAHHPSDTIGGGILGAAGALLVIHWFASRKVAVALAPDGRPGPLPAGPEASRKGVARPGRAP